MPIAEALAILAPASISQIFRGVVEPPARRGSRKSYPTRSMWPSVIATSSNRLFAITDYEAKAAEEPLNEDAFEAFLDELSVHGAGFEERLLGLLGRRDLRPLALSNFPDFGAVLGPEQLATVNAISSRRLGQRRPFVRRTPALTGRLSFTPESPAGCRNTLSRAGRAGSTRLLYPAARNACSTRGQEQNRPA